MIMRNAVKKLMPSHLLKLIRPIKYRIIRHDFLRAKHRLQSSIELTDDEKQLLHKVALQVHHSDSMYQPDGALHYLSVGLSASRCIHKAIGSLSNKYPIEEILDFPCGYGRVLRFLRAMFPASHITAAEIDSNALNFCRQTFSVTTLLSKTNLGELSHLQRFDLIWCGSLFTHIDESSAITLLRFFQDHLTERGLCVFTTHGQQSIEWIQSSKMTYGLTEDGQRKIVQEFQTAGYGYADYPNQSGYGISAVSHDRMVELAKATGGWAETLFIEHGWDNHQDVYAFAVQMPNQGVQATR
ncbi:MAG: class I SAM-dependent methyltransferase [Betaproteobacteria bacterium]|nr:class I SAM-dependent methyltransferase [Betaproteobacteria bacterium]